jgi:hypothetical protein
MVEVPAPHVIIAMFDSLGTRQLYRITVTHDPNNIAHFEHFSRDGKDLCGINRASSVINMGILYGTKPTEEEVRAQLTVHNPVIIGRLISSTGDRHVFCSICFNDSTMDYVGLTPLNHVVCCRCQRTYCEIYKPILSNLVISAPNFAYLDTHIGLACHPKYEDETTQFITKPQ